MYIAIALMLTGILFGRVARKFLNSRFIARVVFFAVLLLLFLLGLQIGANERLFTNLPSLGGNALAITIGALAGSMLCARLLENFLRRHGYFKDNHHA